MDELARALILFAIACGDPPPAEVIDGCRLGAVETLRSDASGSLAIAPGMIALVDRGSVITDGARFELEGARAALALERIGAGYVLIAYGEHERAPFLIARAIDRSGRPIGAAVRSAFATDVRSTRRAADDRAAYLAWSARDGTRSLEIWTMEREGLAHRTVALGDEPASDEAPVEVLGVAAREGAWVVVWRRGAPEAHESAIFVTTANDHAAVEELHEAVAIESLAIDGDLVSVVASFEYSRPHRVRLRDGGIVSAEELAPDAALEVRGALDRDGDALMLRRTNAAGDPIGSIVIARGDLRDARIAGRDGRWTVAWIAGSEVRARRIACPLNAR